MGFCSTKLAAEGLVIGPGRANGHSMNRQYPEPVTVKAWLKGDQFDLDRLVELFPAGDIRVVKDGDEFYLAALEIDSEADGSKFYEVAPEVLQRVNGMARAMHPNDYRPVELVGRYQVGENRHHVVLADCAEAREQAMPVTVVVGSGAIEARGRLTAVGTVTRSGEPAPLPPPQGPKYLALAAQHSDVAEALTIMGNAEPNWVELYKVYEIIRDNIRPAKIEDKGWATKQEQSTFTGSANRPDVGGAYARHARTSGVPPVRIMSLQQARHFIGDLVVRWIKGLQP